MRDGRRPWSHQRAILALGACALAWASVASASSAARRTDRSIPGGRPTMMRRVPIPVIQRPARPPATSTEVGTATLWVIDEAGHPQAFAYVSLASAERTREFPALTDERGSVTLAGVPTGR